MRSIREEEGQAVMLVAVAMSIFLIGAIGLGVDGSHLYAQRQMAQSAADAAAQAGMMSIFDGTNTVATNPARFATSAGFTCAASDARTPCKYANLNGFDAGTGDTVTIAYPGSASVPGVALATDFPTTLIQVAVTRNVSTTLMRLLGPSATSVTATATAAIVSVQSPVPILVTHPTLTQSLALGGNGSVTICGGPNRSIQVNSNALTAWGGHGSVSIDLSHAGPNDPGNCTTGTGADFGSWGGPATNPGFLVLGSTGTYRDPASPIQDPLANVAAPSDPGFAGTQTTITQGTSGCPAGGGSCTLYSPGDYSSSSGITVKNQTAVFKPGIYYVQNGITCTANCNMYMATGFTDSGAGSTSTGWTGNVLFYNTGTGTGKSSTYAPIDIGANGTVSLVGSPAGSAYKGMLFFEDRTAPALSHSLGGGGAMTLLGTIYLTNTRATMLGDATQYQALTLGGNSGNSTLIQGEIIVGTLTLQGTPNITMDLNPAATLFVDQVALVN